MATDVDIVVAPGFPTATVHDPKTAAKLNVTINSHWSGGDEALETLLDIGDIQTIQLQDAKLSYKAVRYIVQLEDLGSLSIRKGDIEPAAYRAFRRVRPNVHVFATGDGYLGVNGSDGPAEGFLVTGTRDEGGAQKAGILKGDVITSLNGIPIKDLADVSLFVFHQQPRHPFRAEVLRSGERLTLEGKLGRR